MKIKRYDHSALQNVLALLSDNVPYVLPHHPYTYWIMGEYFPALNWVAHEEDAIVGFVCALHSHEKNCIFVWQLVIDRSFRRTGAAKQLCDELIRYATKHNIKSIQLTIDDENASSIHFFSSLATGLGGTFEKTVLNGLEIFENESAYEIKL